MQFLTIKLIRKMSAIPIHQLLDYVNQARTSPLAFVKFVQEQVDAFIDEMSMPLYPGCLYSTNEGKGAWLEAIKFLESVAPLPEFKLHEALNLTAKDHAKDMEANNIDGHRGSNGSTLTERIQRRCQKFGSGSWAENISSSFNIAGMNHALKSVLALIIDDGVKSRGHRQTLFSAEFNYIGIYSVNKGKKLATVMNFHSEDLVIENNEGSKIEQQAPKVLQQNKPKKVIINTEIKTKTTTVNGVSKTMTEETIYYADGSSEKIRS